MAPTDDAFVQYDILTDNARFEIFADPVLLGEFMRHHLLANERFLEDIQPLAAVESASGRLLPITTVDETDVFIAGSRIVESDVILHNGLLHVMDAVISPPEIERSGDCTEPLPLSIGDASGQCLWFGIYRTTLAAERALTPVRVRHGLKARDVWMRLGPKPCQ